MASMTTTLRQTEPASVIGRGLLDSGEDVALVPSGSEPGSTHLVRLVGPDQTYRCDCRAASFGTRCRHVDAVIAQDLGALLKARALKAEFAAYRVYLADNYPADGWN